MVMRWLGAWGVVALQSSSLGQECFACAAIPIGLSWRTCLLLGRLLGTDHVHLRLWVLVQGSRGISGEGHGRCCGSRMLVATLF